MPIYCSPLEQEIVDILAPRPGGSMNAHALMKEWMTRNAGPVCEDVLRSLFKSIIDTMRNKDVVRHYKRGDIVLRPDMRRDTAQPPDPETALGGLGQSHVSSAGRHRLHSPIKED